MTQEAKQEAEAAGRDVSLPWCLSRFPVGTTVGTFVCANRTEPSAAGCPATTRDLPPQALGSSLQEARCGEQAGGSRLDPGRRQRPLPR